MANHTAGQWRSDPKEAWHDDTIPVWAGDCVVANVWPIGGESEEARECGESIANAHLMAAAPELLAVVRRIIANCEEGKPSRHIFADGKGTLSGCSMSIEDIAAAQAAIAKAEGR